MHTAAICGLVVAALVAGCGGSAPAPSERASASIGTVPTLLPSGAAGNPAASGEAETVLLGAFRRGSVPVPPALEQAATTTCRSKPVPAYVEEIGSRPVVVTDMRGLGVVLLVFADDRGASGCRVEVAEDGSMRAQFFAVKEDPSKPVEAGAITLGAMEYPRVGGTQRVIAVGRAGDRVVHVRAGFDDDTYVTATLTDGWYAMWWPGQTRPAVIVGADNRNEATGTVTPP